MTNDKLIKMQAQRLEKMYLIRIIDKKTLPGPDG